MLPPGQFLSTLKTSSASSNCQVNPYNLHLLLHDTPCASSSSFIDIDDHYIVACHPTILCVVTIDTERGLERTEPVSTVADPVVDTQC